MAPSPLELSLRNRLSRGQMPLVKFEFVLQAKPQSHFTVRNIDALEFLAHLPRPPYVAGKQGGGQNGKIVASRKRFRWFSAPDGTQQLALQGVEPLAVRAGT